MRITLYIASILFMKYELYTCRVKCNISENVTVSNTYVDVNVTINRAGVIETAILPNGFRYAVSYTQHAVK